MCACVCVQGSHPGSPWSPHFLRAAPGLHTQDGSWWVRTGCCSWSRRACQRGLTGASSRREGQGLGWRDGVPAGTAAGCLGDRDQVGSGWMPLSGPCSTFQGFWGGGPDLPWVSGGAFQQQCGAGRSFQKQASERAVKIVERRKSIAFLLLPR